MVVSCSSVKSCAAIPEKELKCQLEVIVNHFKILPDILLSVRLVALISLLSSSGVILLVKSAGKNIYNRYK